MRDPSKTKQVLIQELASSRQRIEELEQSESEWKEGKEGLKKSKARFSSYFDLPLHGIAITSPEKEWIEVNDRICSMMGYSRDEIIRMTWSEMTHPDDLAADLEQFNRVLSGQIEHYNMDKRFIRKDGKIVWTNLSVGCVRKSDGSVDYIIALVEDITSGKLAEEALRESENKYRLLADNVEDVIFVLDMNLNYTYISPSVKILRGYEPAEVLKQTITEILTPASLDLAMRTLSEAIELEKSEHRKFPVSRMLQLEMRRKDGTTVWTEVKFSAIRVENQQEVSILGLTRDITERKRAEETLRSSEQRLSGIIEFLPDATLVIDKEGKVIYWNRAIEVMTGVKAEDVLGKGNYEYALPFYGERRPMLIDLVLHPQPEREKSYTHIRKIGDILFGEAYSPGLMGGKTHVASTASVLRNAEGEIIAAIECIRDNTEQRQAQEDLHQAVGRYRSIFENAQEGIFRSTPDGIVIMANQAMANMYGYESPEEMMTSITDIAGQHYLNPEDRRKLKEMIEEHGFIKKHEGQNYRKDGSIIWVSRTMHAVRDEKGQIMYYDGIIEDITNRKQTVERIRKALGATIQAIAVMVETRDPYTAGHQRRVADLARAIATEMNLSVDQTDGIRMAASIHDIGKISVPAEILSKPTRLTDIEFSLIKTHSLSGYNILKDIEFPWPIARMILEHHERMDGSGYPDGLTGENILLGSRILSVADVVESMASDRPYRPAIGIGLALEEIERNQGVLYDPPVVQTCLLLIKDKGFQWA